VNETTSVPKPVTALSALSVAAVAVVSFVWIVMVFGLAVYLTRNTKGENVGKFVGTIFSGIAFGPPAVVFFRRYRAAADRDAAQRVRQHSSTNQPLGPTEGSQPD
jgi:hypothetical protein